MTQAFDVNLIVRNNPAVDAKKLQQGLEVLRELRSKGLVKEKGYDLVSPFSRPVHPRATMPKGVNKDRTKACARRRGV